MQHNLIVIKIQWRRGVVRQMSTNNLVQDFTLTHTSHRPVLAPMSSDASSCFGTSVASSAAAAGFAIYRESPPL